MIGSIGIPELVVIFIMGMLWLVPVAAAIWALVTLHGLRTGQQAMATRLEAIERLLQASR